VPSKKLRQRASTVLRVNFKLYQLFQPYQLQALKGGGEHVGAQA
jgi:hypothetical protein